MRKNVLLLILILFISVQTYGDLQNTFEKGGVSISGGISVHGTMNGLFTEGIYDDSNYVELTVFPILSLFIFDYIDISISPYLHYVQSGYWESTNEFWLNSMNLGIKLGFEYYHLFSPKASNGFVPSFGVNLGMDFEPGLSSVIDDIDYKDNETLIISPLLAAAVKLFWFIHDKMAFFIYLSEELKSPVYYQNYSGDSVQIDFVDNIQLTTDIGFGITFYMPHKDRVLF